MHVIRDVTIGPNGDAGLVASLPQEALIEAVVVVAKEDALAPIAVLRDVVRQAGDDETRLHLIESKLPPPHFGFLAPSRPVDHCRFFDGHILRRELVGEHD